MFLRFENAVAGIGFTYEPGEVVDWPDDVNAAVFVRHRLAKEAARAQGRPVRRHARSD